MRRVRKTIMRIAPILRENQLIAGRLYFFYCFTAAQYTHTHMRNNIFVGSDFQSNLGALSSRTIFRHGIMYYTNNFETVETVFHTVILLY